MRALNFMGSFLLRGPAWKSKGWGSPGRAFAPLLHRNTSTFPCAAHALPWVQGLAEAGDHPPGLRAALSPQLISDPISR